MRGVQEGQALGFALVCYKEGLVKPGVVELH